MEAQGLDTADPLAQFGIGELAGDGRGNHRVDPHILSGAVLQNPDHIHDVGLVHNGAEGALIAARAAGNALAVVDLGLTGGRHGDGLDLAGVLTGAFPVHDGGVGAGFRAQAAVDALGLVDHRVLVVFEADGPLGAGVLAPVGQTAPADLRDRIAAGGTLIAGDGQDLNGVGIVRITAHGHVNPLADDGPLLVNAAAHGGMGAGGNELGDVEHRLIQPVLPLRPGHFPEHLVFQQLHLGIKLSHLRPP